MKKFRVLEKNALKSFGLPVTGHGSSESSQVTVSGEDVPLRQYTPGKYASRPPGGNKRAGSRGMMKSISQNFRKDRPGAQTFAAIAPSIS